MANDFGTQDHTPKPEHPFLHDIATSGFSCCLRLLRKPSHYLYDLPNLHDPGILSSSSLRVLKLTIRA